ncbi:MAG: vapC1 [Myxococcaceae bacterium]|nr:vapC1 [Myxococcaceae bacterium]
MRYVLDTNVVSALMRGDPHVVERLRTTSKSEVAVPQPVIAELAYGIERLPKSARKERLRARLTAIGAEVTRVPWTDQVSETFGVIKAALERRGERIEDFDVAIAAHALAHGGVLVTANRKHMARVTSLEIEDWAVAK